MKVKVSNMTDKSFLEIKSRTDKKVSDYIKAHKGINLLTLMSKLKLTITYMSNNTICNNCGHIEEKGSYAIAQKAMGHPVTFTCDCGHSFNV